MAAGYRHPSGLIGADDLYLVPDPIGGQIYSAAVAARFYPLFDHFFTVYFEFDLVAGSIGGEFLLISEILITVLIFNVWHLGLPLFDIKIECYIVNLRHRRAAINSAPAALYAPDRPGAWAGGQFPPAGRDKKRNGIDSG